MVSVHSKAQTILINHGIKPSFQRMKILGYMLDRRNHPTCEKIYSDLLEEIPTLSKSTVYNTMKILSDERITQIISSNNNESHYDIVDIPHGHFICEVCGGIEDIPLEKGIVETGILSNYQVHILNIEIGGICPLCFKK